MKRLLFLLLVLVLSLSLIPLTVGASPAGDLSYEISNGEVTITDCNESVTGALVIPGSIHGYPVTAIGQEAFAYCRGLTDVEIPDSVTTIGYAAFRDCVALKEVEIPDSVTYLADYVFYQCENLKKVSLPVGIEKIGTATFCSTVLTEVTIPKNVTVIGDSAFAGCGALTRVTFPKKLTIIEEQAFSGCDKLAEAILPEGVTSIGDSAFANCYELTQFPLPSTLTFIGDEAFIGCIELEEVTIPDSVTHIGEYAFGLCWNFYEITIPAGVTFIGDCPFFECYNLTAIHVAEDNDYYCADEYGVLYDKNKTQLIQAPIASMRGAYVVAEGVTTIKKLSLYMCTELTQLELPASLTTIEDSGIYYCTGLKELTLPEGFTTLGEFAIGYCTSLRELVVPASVTTVGEQAFFHCTGLDAIYFRGDAPAFGWGIFMDVKTEVYYEAGAKGWADAVEQDHCGEITWVQQEQSDQDASNVSGTVEKVPAEKKWEIDNAYGYVRNDYHSEACSEDADGEMYTIYFDNSFHGFEEIVCYWSSTDINIPAEITHVIGDIYSARVPAGRKVEFCYREYVDGPPADGYLYTHSGVWIPYNGCAHSWDNGVEVSCRSCTQDGLDVYTCKNCAQTFEVRWPAYSHSLINGSCMDCGATMENTIKVYLDAKASNGEKVRILWWGSEFCVQFTGEEMTHEGGTIYSAIIAEDAYDLYFGVGDASCKWLQVPGDGYVYIMGEQRWEKYCAHEYEDGSCIRCSAAEPNHEEYTVYFDLNVLPWEQVYVFCSTDSGVVTSWPGELMTYEGGTVYSARVPSDVTVLNFNNDDSQITVDLTLPGNGYIYHPAEQSWRVYNGCPHEWYSISEMWSDPTCEESAWRYYECYDCGEYITMECRPYGHDGKNGICTRCGQAMDGLVKKEDGWYYYQNGVRSQVTTLVKYNGEWWYVVNGKVASDTTTLVKYNGEWWYVVKGKIASKTTTLVKYNGEWWYVVKGKIASKTTTLVKYNGEWWYVVKGKIASKTTTLVKYNGEWWYVVKGKIASKTTTLVSFNGGWYYIYKGKLAAQTTTLVKYNGAWYYVNKGTVDWGYSGTFSFNGGNYRIVKGRVA